MREWPVVTPPWVVACLLPGKQVFPFYEDCNFSETKAGMAGSESTKQSLGNQRSEVEDGIAGGLPVNGRCKETVEMARGEST